MNPNYLLTSILLMLLLNLFQETGNCQTMPVKDHNIEKDNVSDAPLINWTAANDAMNFRYDFLEDIETITLYPASPENGTFSHHSHITYFKGVIYATWDNGYKDENGSGQRGSMRRSYDKGKTWTKTEILFPSLDRYVPANEAYIGSRFQTSNGFIVIDGTLYALSDVAEWKGPSIKHRRRKVLGRVCRTVNPDGTLGKIFWLKEDAPEPVEGFPSFPPGKPELVKKINKYIEQPGHEIQLDFGRGNHPVSDDNHGLTEPVPSWEINDGIWVKLFRDGGSKTAKTFREIEETKSRRNYASFSFDNGKTWTVPTRTNFPDACARSNAGRLPDGQFYVINNVLPLSPKKGGRALLAISLSYDGLTFDRVRAIRFLPPPQRYKGRAKSVGFQYPHSVVVENNLWIMYSVNKEDIQVTRIPLSDLEKL